MWRNLAFASTVLLLTSGSKAAPSPPASIQASNGGTPFMPQDADSIQVSPIVSKDPTEIQPAVDVMHNWLCMLRQVWERPSQSPFKAGYWTDDKVPYGRIRLSEPLGTALTPQQVGWAGIFALSNLLISGSPEATSIPLSYSLIYSGGKAVGQFSQTFAGPGDSQGFGSRFNNYQNITSSTTQPSPLPAASKKMRRDTSDDDWTDPDNSTAVSNAVGPSDSNVHLTIKPLGGPLPQMPVLELFKNLLQNDLYGNEVDAALSSKLRKDTRFAHQDRRTRTFLELTVDTPDQGGKSATFGDAEQVVRMLLNHPYLRGNPQSMGVEAYLTDSNGKKFDDPYVRVQISVGPVNPGILQGTAGNSTADAGN